MSPSIRTLVITRISIPLLTRHSRSPQFDRLNSIDLPDSRSTASSRPIRRSPRWTAPLSSGRSARLCCAWDCWARIYTWSEVYRACRTANSWLRLAETTARRRKSDSYEVTARSWCSAVCAPRAPAESPARTASRRRDRSCWRTSSSQCRTIVTRMRHPSPCMGCCRLSIPVGRSPGSSSGRADPSWRIADASETRSSISWRSSGLGTCSSGNSAAPEDRQCWSSCRSHFACSPSPCCACCAKLDPRRLTNTSGARPCPSWRPRRARRGWILLAGPAAASSRCCNGFWALRESRNSYQRHSYNPLINSILLQI